MKMSGDPVNVKVKVYSSESESLFQWKWKFIPVKVKVYSSESESLFQWKMRIQIGCDTYVRAGMTSKLAASISELVAVGCVSRSNITASCLILSDGQLMSSDVLSIGFKGASFFYQMSVVLNKLKLPILPQWLHSLY